MCVCVPVAADTSHTCDNSSGLLNTIYGTFFLPNHLYPCYTWYEENLRFIRKFSRKSNTSVRLTTSVWRVGGRCVHCCSVLAGTVGVAVGCISSRYVFRVSLTKSTACFPDTQLFPDWSTCTVFSLPLYL